MWTLKKKGAVNAEKYAANETSTFSTSHGKATDHAMAFAISTPEVLSRQKPPTTFLWTPAAWEAVGNVGALQRLSDINEEILARNDWVVTNSIALTVEGIGEGAAALYYGSLSITPSKPSVITDKDDYAPGATATITATGFDVGATVTFEVDHISDAGSDGVFGTSDDTLVELGGEGHDPWTVTDGGSGDLDGQADGTITTAWYVNPDDSLNERFLLTATDTATDLVASTSFTDSSHTFSGNWSISSSADDAEERASGSVKLSSSDLELVFDKSDQTVGLRFTGLDIPQGVTITNAYIQFQADEAQSEATSLQIWGQATDNAVAFTSARGNITSRSTTDARVDWNGNDLPAWTKGDATLDQRTPDLKAIVQEIVDLHWTPQSGSMAFIISGTGHRTAESFDGNEPAAPLLHIEWEEEPSDPNNIPPVAFDDNGYAVNEDGTLTIATSLLLANDTDPDNEDSDPSNDDTLRITTVGSAANGTLWLNNDTITYTPNTDFYGTDSFTYFANDGSTNSIDPAAVTITVNAVNDAPVAKDDTFTTNNMVVSGDVFAENGNGQDSDPDGAFAVSAVNGNVSDVGKQIALASSGALLTLNANGTFDYNPNGFTGTDSFTYTIADGNGGTDTATVTIADDASFDFWVIADTPYTSSAADALSGYMNNVPAEVEFVIHLGDIKSGSSSSVVLEDYTSVATLLQQSSVPVFIIPGDNEYNDTNNPDLAWTYWEANFGHFDQNWAHNFQVSYQVGREENFAFVSSDTLFVGINLVGGSVHDSQEWADRAADDLAWIQSNFTQYSDQAENAVVFGHAFPGDSSEYNAFEDGLISAAQNFSDPILYLQGDKHTWQLDQPWPQAPNMTRVILEKTDASNDPLLVSVSGDPTDPFAYDHIFIA